MTFALAVVLASPIVVATANMVRSSPFVRMYFISETSLLALVYVTLKVLQVHYGLTFSLSFRIEPIHEYILLLRRGRDCDPIFVSGGFQVMKKVDVEVLQATYRELYELV